MDNSIKRTVVGLCVILLLLLGGIFAVNPIVFGSTTVFKLKPAPSLTGQISQTLINNTNGSALLVAGSDYNLQDTMYFDSGTWVVTTMVPTSEKLERGFVVLKRQGLVFTVVQGPGTAFARNSMKGFPNDVVQYLDRQGALYDL